MGKQADRGRRAAGMALVSCAVILTAILLLALATRQLVGESAAASLNGQDRLMALQAAQAALADAEQAIAEAPDAAAIPNTSLDLPVGYGSVTANQLPFGGRLQSMRLPAYRIFLQELSEDPVQGSVRYLYQVTAVGNGWRESTQVVLQSVFVRLVCMHPQEGVCSAQRQGRLSWRELPSLPLQADAKP